MCALVPCIAYIATFHGFDRSAIPSTCNGGWPEALEFLSAFFFTAIVIELFQWAVWYVWADRSHLIVATATEATDSVVPSGGGVFFLPRKSLWTVPAIFVCFGIFFWSGTPDACDGFTLSARGLVGCVAFAYATLGVGSFVEFYDRG
jgi:hypothetical protein